LGQFQKGRDQEQLDRWDQAETEQWMKQAETEVWQNLSPGLPCPKKLACPDPDWNRKDCQTAHDQEQPETGETEMERQGWGQATHANEAEWTDREAELKNCQSQVR